MIHFADLVFKPNSGLEGQSPNVVLSMEIYSQLLA